MVSACLGARVTRSASCYGVNGVKFWLPRARTFRKNLRIRVDTRQVLRELRHRRSVGTALVPAPSPEPKADRRSVDDALRRLAHIFPAAAGAAARRYWGGLVDLTPDGLPVLDNRTGPEGLVVVAGLCGHGLALGPVLGEIAADLAVDGATPRPITPFSLDRFAGAVASPEVMI